ncbi:hypothetical protein Zmor_019945 [Zophobas morio]|uniref:Gustatory receptor n=1 Tax=Zophobas morio TaxID=2755281 RepID=A0AA38M9F9_9CUCU|nr:hypothetical protein Zmor_019945 [Zophobas morio]
MLISCFYFKIFLITPWYNFSKRSFSNQKLCKLYGLLLTLVKVVLTGIGIVDASSYDEVLQTILPSQKFIHNVCSATLCSVNIINTARSLWDLNNWELLFKNCQHIYEQLPEKNKVDLKIVMPSFVIKQFVICLLTLYPFFVLTAYFGTPAWKCIFLSHMTGLYYEYLLVSFVKGVVKILKNGYQSLNYKLSRIDPQAKYVEETIRNLAKSYRLLGQTIDIFNTIFGYQLALVIFHCGLQFINALNFLLVCMKWDFVNSFFHFVWVATVSL